MIRFIKKEPDVKKIIAISFIGLCLTGVAAKDSFALVYDPAVIMCEDTHYVHDTNNSSVHLGKDGKWRWSCAHRKNIVLGDGQQDQLNCIVEGIGCLLF